MDCTEDGYVISLKGLKGNFTYRQDNKRGTTSRDIHQVYQNSTRKIALLNLVVRIFYKKLTLDLNFRNQITTMAPNYLPRRTSSMPCDLFG